MSENANNVMETSNQKSTRKKKPARVSRRVAVFGTVVLIFAIIGVVATAIGITKVTTDIIENKSQKEMFKRTVFPLVILDPPAFDSIDKLDSRTILSAGIWDFIMFEDKSKYVKDDLGNMTVPDVDIEAHITKVFGKSAVIEHQELTDSEMQILYDPEGKVYMIPSAASMMSYVPRVDKVSRKGDEYTVTVGYVPSGPVWEGDINGQKYEPEADKFLNYILKKSGKDNYIIIAVKEIPLDDSSSHDAESEDTSPDVSDASALPEASETTSAASTASETSSDISSK
ncbi:MAG: hypothetical protein PUB00_06840 [Clostridiales bacterium]|nr:hypothetical protein [Clostridiales bacterium]